MNDRSRLMRQLSPTAVGVGVGAAAVGAAAVPGGEPKDLAGMHESAAEGAGVGEFVVGGQSGAGHETASLPPEPVEAAGAANAGPVPFIHCRACEAANRPEAEACRRCRKPLGKPQAAVVEREVIREVRVEVRVPTAGLAGKEIVFGPDLPTLGELQDWLIRETMARLRPSGMEAVRTSLKIGKGTLYRHLSRLRMSAGLSRGEAPDAKA